MMKKLIAIHLVMLFIFATAASKAAPRSQPQNDQPPVTGNGIPGVELFDRVMLSYLKNIDCTAATLAVSNRGKIIVSRGYGWCDKEKTTPTQPNTIIGLASCEKSFTVAAVKQLSTRGRLNLDAPLFVLLQIKPRGTITDSRVNWITVRHLINHKAGWGSDPTSSAVIEAREAGLKEPFSTEDLLGFIATHKLENPPGTKEEYCNFGYDTLRYVITKATRRPFIDYFQRELFWPILVTEIIDTNNPKTKNNPPIVWNVADGGPVGASAPLMCFFMRRYWFAGEPRDNGNPSWSRYGSLTGSTSLMIWRPDGIDIAAIFNGRKENVSHDDISKSLQQVLDFLKRRR